MHFNGLHMDKNKTKKSPFFDPRLNPPPTNNICSIVRRCDLRGKFLNNVVVLYLHNIFKFVHKDKSSTWSPTDTWPIKNRLKKE